MLGLCAAPNLRLPRVHLRSMDVVLLWMDVMLVAARQRAQERRSEQHAKVADCGQYPVAVAALLEVADQLIKPHLVGHISRR